MASGKRASMREGPLAQLFRKTEEDEARPEEKPRQEEQPRREEEPKLGRPWITRLVDDTLDKRPVRESGPTAGSR